MKKIPKLKFFFFSILCITAGCSLITAPYKITKGTLKGGIAVVKTTYKVTAGTTKVVYKIGAFTYEVVKAPLSWPLTNTAIESIGGLPVKEAILLGKVKNSPYTVKGKRYYPMSVEEAKNYEETGTASWYGYETRYKKGGHMTANGEAFNPKGLTAAHKYLPLPTFVKVTNLENRRSVIVRVNDRGPFPSENNPRSGDRIIDLSMGAAKRLGYHKNGTTSVKVESIDFKKG
jgi:rare lipoprotein A